MFNSRGLQLIILDFDGVIIESNNIKDTAFRKIFSRFPEHSKDFWQFHISHVSMSRYEKFDYVLENLGLVGDIVFKEQLLQEFSEHTLELMRSVLFVKGAKEFLTAINGKLPLYLASITPISDLEIILDHLQIRSFFTGMYGCPPWTKRDALRDILQIENQSPDTTVLIGDSYGDQRAANETGVHFIGRNSGLCFEEPYPSLMINDLYGLSAFFKPV